MSTQTQIKVNVRYYALLREQRGCSKEEMFTCAQTLQDLYESLKEQYGFTLGVDVMKVALNDEFSSWTSSFAENDAIVFIPPVAGG